MERSETHQSVATKQTGKTTMYSVEAFSPERAAQYAEKMVQLRSKGWGDETQALEDIAKKCGMSARSLKRVIKRETKDVGIRTFGKIRGAYLNFCWSLIQNLKHEVETDMEVHGDAAFADIIADVEALEAKIENAKAIRIRS